MDTQRRGHPWMFRVVRWVLRQLGFAYFDLRVSALEQIPRSGGAIIAGNHPNVLDGVLLLIISPRPVRFLVAEELFFHPLLRWLFEGMGCIPVYRTREHNGDALRAAVAALERGELVGIFPEGTTSDVGRMHRMKRGVGLLALRTGVPVVPLGIAGSAEAYPKERRMPRPRAISLAFAPAIRYVRSGVEVIPGDVLERVLEDIRWEILRTMRWAWTELSTTPSWPALRQLRVMSAALIVMPLAGVLSLTANPSLDPADRA